jgi:hypothetical protein
MAGATVAHQRLGRAQMVPVLSREIVEGEQRLAILAKSNAASASFLVGRFGNRLNESDH